ncbi:hypothetical protein Pelo_64 [Pelomyxa schiedti]|nr:hypothetical protein Pelo_64 [Pelomyxa schiedti]
MGAMRTLTRCGAKHKKEPTCGDAMPRPESLGAVVLKFLRDTEDVKGFGRLAPKDQDSLRHLLETHIPPLIELYNNLNKERVPDTSSDTTSPTLCTTASATATTKTTEPAQSAFFDNPRGSELCDVTRWYYKDDSGDGSDSSGWMPFSVSTDIEEAFQAHQPMCKVSEEQFIDFEEMLLRFFGDFSASTAKPVRRG